MYRRHAKENKIQLFEYKDCNADFNLFNMLRTVTQHVQYNVGEVFVIPPRAYLVGSVA